jgi:NDP-sugar pyrophosphorylase family protein
VKAVVLVAGKGTRLTSLTTNVPKPMLSVGGRPVIDRVLEMVAQSGVREVLMNLHHCAEILTEYCGDGARWGVTLTYAYEPTLLGTAGAVRNFGPLLDGDDPFFVVYGDNYLECDLSRLAEFHRERDGIATIALFEKDDVSGSGIVSLAENGRIRRFAEKPPPSEVFSRLVNGGLYVLSPEVLRLIPDTIPCDFGYDVFPSLMAAGYALYGRVMEGAVWAIDTPLLYERLRARMGDGAR